MVRIPRTLAVLVTVSSLFGLVTPVAAQTLYTITDLGGLPEAPS
jgi:hypothetical protein